MSKQPVEKAGQYQAEGRFWGCQHPIRHRSRAHSGPAANHHHQRRWRKRFAGRGNYRQI